MLFVMLLRMHTNIYLKPFTSTLIAYSRFVWYQGQNCLKLFEDTWMSTYAILLALFEDNGRSTMLFYWSFTAERWLINNLNTGNMDVLHNFVLFFLHIQYVVCLLLRTGVGLKNTEFTDFKITEQHLNAVVRPCLLSCSVLCFENTNCLSFSYNRKTQKCELWEDDFIDIGITRSSPEVGWRYYYIIRGKCCVFCSKKKLMPTWDQLIGFTLAQFVIKQKQSLHYTELNYNYLFHMLTVLLKRFSVRNIMSCEEIATVSSVLRKFEHNILIAKIKKPL